MEFYLERYALSRAKNILNENGADLPRVSSVSVVAGFPHYAPDCQGFGELVSEIVLYHQNSHQFLAGKPIGCKEATNWPYDLKDLNLPSQSVDWMVTDRNFLSRMNDGEVRVFFEQLDRVLKEDGLIFAFYRACLVPFKERMLRSLREKLGLTHNYRRTYEQFRQLTHPLKSVLDADIEDANTFNFGFGLSVLAKQPNLLPSHQGGPYSFVLESYSPDLWGQS